MNGTNGSQRILGLENGLKAFFSQWTEENFPGTDPASVGRILGISFQKAKHLEEIMSAGDQVRAAVLDNRLHPENIPAFNRWNASDQTAYLVFFKDLRLSFQTERQFLEWLPETAFSNKQSIGSILASEEIKRIAGNATLSAPLKIEKIREHLFSLRNPRYDGVHKHWHTLERKTLANMRNVTVTPSLFFEKNRLELRITVTTAGEARQTMEKLAAVPENTWSALIDPTG
jgi:hypothetical protein